MSVHGQMSVQSWPDVSPVMSWPDVSHVMANGVQGQWSTRPWSTRPVEYKASVIHGRCYTWPVLVIQGRCWVYRASVGYTGPVLDMVNMAQVWLIWPGMANNSTLLTVNEGQ